MILDIRTGTTWKPAVVAASTSTSPYPYYRNNSRTPSATHSPPQEATARGPPATAKIQRSECGVQRVKGGTAHDARLVVFQVIPPARCFSNPTARQIQRPQKKKKKCVRLLKYPTSYQYQRVLNRAVRKKRAKTLVVRKDQKYAFG